jgi:hypothetical protein
MDSIWASICLSAASRAARRPGFEVRCERISSRCNSSDCFWRSRAARSCAARRSRSSWDRPAVTSSADLDRCSSTDLLSHPRAISSFYAGKAVCALETEGGGSESDRGRRIGSRGPAGLSLLFTFAPVALGANFGEFPIFANSQSSRILGARSDDEIGKMGPSPKGCGQNPGSPATGLRRWGGNPGSPATGLRRWRGPGLHPTDRFGPWGPRTSSPIFARNADRGRVINRF